MRLFFAAVAALALWLSGCASTEGPYTAQPIHRAEPSRSAADSAAAQPVVFKPYEGEPRSVQVVQIRIPAADLERYPELADKRVGFGMSNMLVEALFDTGRFVFLEEKTQILKRLVDQWELTEDGILAKSPTAPETALQAAEFLVYAEVFDFVACSPLEQIRVARKTRSCVTNVGLQVRIANTATGAFIPGSTQPLSPQGTHIHTVDQSLFASPALSFDQSAVGKASSKAARYALLQALERFDRMGW